MPDQPHLAVGSPRAIPHTTLRLGLDPKAVAIASLMHVGAVLTVWWLPPTPTLLLLTVVLYCVRMLGVTVGFHRYFSHHSFATSRWFAAVLAFWGGLGAQRSAVWWAGHHRVHHRRSDLPGDVHSPVEGSWFWAQMGWWLDASSDETRWQNIKEFADRPELRWLDRHHLVPQLLMAAVLYLVGGVPWLLWGYVLNTVLVWHGLSLLNSWCHRFGSKPFVTKDNSRNSLLVGILAMGEGWHNNHHRFVSSPRHGLMWWQVDLSWLVIRVLSAVGLIWDLQAVPSAEQQAAAAGKATLANPQTT
jgi:stearoyl-CoA desaturase (delta-9 desaturase)